MQSAIIGADFIAHCGLLIDLKKHKLIDSITSLATVGEMAAVTIHGISTVDLQSQLSPGTDIRYGQLIKQLIDISKPNPVPASCSNADVAHYIVTTGPPVIEKARSLVGDKLPAAKEDINCLLDLGVIRPSSSQWASPIHLVPKKTGDWRTTGHFRHLNAQNKPDRYTVPILDDILQNLWGKKIFSTIDLVRAYHPIPVASADIEKTAVAIPVGLYEFLGMPPGLRNETQTFYRPMNMNILRGLDFVSCYIDDLIVASHSHEEHV